MIQVAFSPQAEQDLEDIGDYIAFDSPARALAFIRKVRERCEGIALAPEGYPVCSQYGDGVRKVAYQKYMLFYFYEPEEARVTIIHVAHGASLS